MTSEAVLSVLQKMFGTAFKPVPKDWIHRPDFLIEYFSRQGKRLRPTLLLATYLMTRSRLDGRHGDLTESYITHAVKMNPWLLELASSLERLHVALMALDDVFDRATSRRGRPALHLLHEEHVARKEWGYHVGREQWIHPPSSRAYVLDRATLTVIDLWQAMLRAAGVKPLRIAELNDVANRLLVGNVRLSKEKYDPAKPDPQIEFAFDELLAHVQQVIDMLRQDRIQRGVYGWQYELLGLLLDTYQSTLDGERIDLDWSGTCTTQDERRLWQHQHPRNIPRRHPRSKMPTVDDLVRNQRLKTSFYSIYLPVIAGAMLANPDLAYTTSAALSSFAYNFGEAFQIADDLLLLRPESETGKSSLQDLNAQSKTSITVTMYWSLPPEKRKGWLKLLGQCRASERARKQALEQIRQSKTEKECRRMIRDRVVNCRSALAILDHDGYWIGPLQYIATRAIGWMDDARVTVEEER